METESATILIVDDEEDIRWVLQDRLEFGGYRVLTAADGVAGVETIRAEEPDLILLDIQMPRMDGFEVMKTIREEKLEGTVVVMTAHGTVQRAVQAMKEGATDFLLKPFQAEDVEQSVDRALERVRLRRENTRLQQELKTAQDRLIAEMEQQLQAAHRLQMELMPKEGPEVEGVDIAGRCIPATQVGGDFFQYFCHGEGQLAFTLTDVSGKGMEAAVPAVLFDGILESQMELGGSVQDLFFRLNLILHRKLPSASTFVCFVMGDLQPETGVLSLASAACPPAYHFRSATGRLEELSLGAYPLGVRPDTTYRATEIRLERGDRVILCSDGVAEAENASDEQFGYERTAEAIQAICREDLASEATIDRIFETVVTFRGNAPQSDDMTCVVLRME